MYSKNTFPDGRFGQAIMQHIVLPTQTLINNLIGLIVRSYIYYYYTNARK